MVILKQYQSKIFKTSKALLSHKYIWNLCQLIVETHFWQKSDGKASEKESLKD